MIQVNLNDIINASETFSKIMRQTLSGALAFKIARLARELNKEVETFNSERQKILDRFCEKDENGNFAQTEDGMIKIIPEKISDFNNEFQTLLDTEVEINAEKIPLKDIDEIKISPQEMLNIDKFIE